MNGAACYKKYVFTNSKPIRIVQSIIGHLIDAVLKRSTVCAFITWCIQTWPAAHSASTVACPHASDLYFYSNEPSLQTVASKFAAESCCARSAPPTQRACSPGATSISLLPSSFLALTLLSAQ
eukprot:TRINITY_DN69_c0_g4_i1.p2 TRINITY_DN69_c0_g4~~TRINITY_DN69_c0_g4_i1.p2  ORF type:complete len:123 (+),score=11.38 TRINITY_DN69_c0_g4_i1:326-694(+)